MMDLNGKPIGHRSSHSIFVFGERKSRTISNSSFVSARLTGIKGSAASIASTRIVRPPLADLRFGEP